MTAAVARIASWLGLNENVVLVGIVVCAGLAIGSVIRGISLRRAAPADRRRHLGSLSVWWVMLGLVLAAVRGGPLAGALLCTAVSWIGLYEFFRLLDKRGMDRRGRLLVYGSAPLAHTLAALSGDAGQVSLVLAAVTIGVTVRLVACGTTTGFLAMAASLVWGHAVIVFCLAHLVLLLTIRPEENLPGGAAGWFVWVIAFTECDDIFQALWGRKFGRHKITPAVSPGKTWEGFLLGGATATVIGAVLAPYLTPLGQSGTVALGGWTFPLPGVAPFAAGFVLCLAALFGDLNFSALKRDIGVKDTGNWLPGQGGILDRVDSLLFTAPVCYYLARCFHD